MLAFCPYIYKCSPGVSQNTEGGINYLMRNCGSVTHAGHASVRKLKFRTLPGALKSAKNCSVRYVRAEAELYAAKNLREEKEKKLGFCM